MKRISILMLLLGVANPLLAQSTGTLTYGPAGEAVHPVPIPSLLLLPLGIVLALIGLRCLGRSGARQVLGLLLTAAGVVSGVSSGIYIQETTADPATIELSNPEGSSIEVPTGLQDYLNTSGVTLEIRSVSAPEPYCTSDDPAAECRAGDTLENGASCQTSFTCIPPVAAQAVNDTVAIANGANAQVNVLDNDLGDAPLTVLSFGGSPATVGSTSADGSTVLSLPIAGGTLDVSMADTGEWSATANGTAGASTVTVHYLMASGNGTSDAGTLTVEIGDVSAAVDDNLATLGSGNEYVTDAGVTLNVGVGVGLLNNDTLGTPAATLSRWGGGDAGASPDLAPGDSTPFAGGTLTVNADGSFDLVSPIQEGTFTFDYVLGNSIGHSQASVELYISQAPVATADSYTVTNGMIDSSNNVTDNDDLGASPATVSFYADSGDIGGASQVASPSVYTHPVGSFTVVIDSSGNMTIDTSVGGVLAGTYTFDYEIQNSTGNSHAVVTVEVEDP